MDAAFEYTLSLSYCTVGVCVYMFQLKKAVITTRWRERKMCPSHTDFMLTCPLTVTYTHSYSIYTVYIEGCLI